MFNGSSRIWGGGSNSYTQYKEEITKLSNQQASQPSLTSIRGSVVNSNGQMRTDVSLQNISTTPITNASLYAVVYERVFFDDEWHNVVRGVTKADTISLNAGEPVDYQLNCGDYNPNYGVVVILKSVSGQIIQAYQAK